jgi:predicted alpha/beta-fold hydrolase
MPIVERYDYDPPCWIRHNLAMYVWANSLRRVPKPSYDSFETIATPKIQQDGFFELAWWRASRGRKGDKVALIVPGVSGGAYARTTRGMARALHEKGWDVAVWVFRDTGEVPTKVRPTYSGYGLDDLNLAMDHVAKDYDDISLVGLSIGGNIVIQYLCSTQDDRVSRAVAISPPIAFGKTVEHWSRGLMGRLVISRAALSNMKRLVARKVDGSDVLGPSDVEAYAKVRSVAEADHFVTSEFNGYPHAWGYWAKADTSNALRMPVSASMGGREGKGNLLILTAKDDPMLESHSYPHADALPEGVTMELTRHGSHISFVPRGFRKRIYWSEQRVLDHLSS